MKQCLDVQLRLLQRAVDNVGSPLAAGNPLDVVIGEVKRFAGFVSAQANEITAADEWYHVLDRRPGQCEPLPSPRQGDIYRPVGGKKPGGHNG